MRCAIGDIKFKFCSFVGFEIEVKHISSHFPFPGAATGLRPDLLRTRGKLGCFGAGVPDVVVFVSIASSRSLDTEGVRSSCLPVGAAFFGGALSVGKGTIRIVHVAMDSTTESTCGVLVVNVGLASRAEVF